MCLRSRFCKRPGRAKLLKLLYSRVQAKRPQNPFVGYLDDEILHNLRAEIKIDNFLQMG
jgi:hypothetical protein